MDIGEGFSSTSRPPSAGLEGLRQIGKLPPVDGRRAAAKLTVSIRELLGTGVALRAAVSRFSMSDRPHLRWCVFTRLLPAQEDHVQASKHTHATLDQVQCELRHRIRRADGRNGHRLWEQAGRTSNGIPNEERMRLMKAFRSSISDSATGCLSHLAIRRCGSAVARRGDHQKRLRTVENFMRETKRRTES